MEWQCQQGTIVLPACKQNQPKPTLRVFWGKDGWKKSSVQGGEVPVMHKMPCRTVVTARSHCPSGKAPKKSPPFISWPPSQTGSRESESAAET